MSEYREIPPPPRLAHTVECFWTLQLSSPDGLHRVVPDGCADILFTNKDGHLSLEAIGPMTSYRDFPVLDGRLQVAVRFRPGMWTPSLGIPGDRIIDQAPPLADLWGSRAKELLDRLADASTPEQCAALLAGAVRAVEHPDPVQQALAWVADRRGLVSIEAAAEQAGISGRQFRRSCIQHSGLSPKFLARILRFRHALARVHECPRQWAGLALDCGYYDQAHFINEFRELSGRTPSQHGMADFSNRAAPAAP